MISVATIKKKILWYKLTLNKKKVKQYQHMLKIFSENYINVMPDDYGCVSIDVFGKNNHIVIDKISTHGAKIRLNIVGNNNFVHIHQGLCSSGNVNIYIGQNHHNFGPVHDVKLTIGKNCSFESTDVFIKNSHAELSIGDKCMFAFGINLYHTDSHPIMSKETGKIINVVKTMHIGNHVWVGANVTILKNSYIADDSIVGWGSIVSGVFKESNCILAGNPAKIVKTGITWDSDGSKGYVQNSRV